MSTISTEAFSLTDQENSQRIDWTLWTDWAKSGDRLSPISANIADSLDELDALDEVCHQTPCHYTSSNFVSLSPTILTNVSPANSPQKQNKQESGCGGGLLLLLLCCCCCCCGSCSNTTTVWCQSVTRLVQLGQTGASLSPDNPRGGDR